MEAMRLKTTTFNRNYFGYERSILHLGLGHYGVWNPENFQYPFTMWKKVGFVRNSKIHNPKFCRKVEVNVKVVKCLIRSLVC